MSFERLTEFFKRTFAYQKVLISLCLVVVIWAMVVPGFTTHAQSFNQQINYQGKLTNTSGLAVPNGTYQMVFNLYTVPTGGSPIWTETLSGANEVTVDNGLFSVMLGSSSPLTSVNFNQTLYLGVTIEGDSEMSPRKVIGAVPAAFEAKNANTVGGVASTSLVRNDTGNSIVANLASTLFSLTQNGVGDIVNIFDGVTEVFTILDGGNVGIGSTTPGARLSVAGTGFFSGDLTATGTTTLTTLNLTNALSVTSGGTGFNAYSSGDFLYAAGTNSLARRTIGVNGQIMQVVGGVPDWVSTSTLGISLSDTTGILGATRGGTGTSTVTQNFLLIGGAGNTWTQAATSSLGLSPVFTNSSALADLVSDEVGTGALVLATNPIFGGTATFLNLTASSATSTNISTTNLTVTGIFRDTTLSAGGNGQILQSTGTSTRWVATSSLGFPAAHDPVTLAGTPNYLTLSGQEITLNQLDLVDDLNTFTSDNLANRLTNETGTGLVVFSDAPTFTGLATLANFIATNATVTSATTTNLGVTTGTITNANFTSATTTNLAVSGLNAGRVPYLTTNGRFIDSTNLTFDGTTLTALSGSFTSATSTNFGFTTLSGTTGLFTSATTTNLGVTTGTITNLAFTSATGTNQSLTNLTVSGAFRDSALATGTLGMVLQSTGTSTRWVATSSLGLGSGASTFLALTDTDQVSYNANRIIFTNSGATGLTDSANFTFDGTTLTTVNTSLTSATTTNLAITGLTLGRLPYATTSGRLIDSANLTFNGTTLTALQGSFTSATSTNFGFTTLSGTTGIFTSATTTNLGVTTGTITNAFFTSATTTNLAITGLTLGRLPYATTSGRLIDSANLTFNGTTLTALQGSFTSATSTNFGFTTLSGTTGIFTSATTTNLGVTTGTITNANFTSATSTNGRLTNLTVSGAFRDSALATGTLGMVLQSTATSTRWVATSSLGLGGGGVSTFLALTDTDQSSYTANRIIFTNSGATGLTDSANFTFNGSTLTVTGNGSFSTGVTIATGQAYSINGAPVLRIYDGQFLSNSNFFLGSVPGSLNTTQSDNNLGIGTLGTLEAITTGDENLAIGTYALQRITTNSNNVAVGNSALTDMVVGGSNTALGSQAAGLVSGSENVFIGNLAANNLATSSGSVIIGTYAGLGPANYNAERLTLIGRSAGENLGAGADNNILIGYNAGDALTSGANNLLIGYDIDAPSNSASNQMSIGNLIFGTGIDGTGTTISSGNIGIGSSTPGSRLSVNGTMQVTGGTTLSSATSTNLGVTTGTITNANFTSATSTNGRLTNLTVSGAFRDSALATGTLGMVLQSTGTSTRWVATSSLGLGGGGVSTFLALTDTDQSSYTANRIIFTNSGATGLTDSANFTFDGTNLVLGTDVGLTRGAANRLDLATGDTLNLVSGPLQIAATDVITSGRLFLSATGTAANPAFAISGDVDTGMFSTASNTLNFSTGGTERLRIDSSGNVGIGTTSPNARLSLDRRSLTGSLTAGFDRYYGLDNATLNAVQIGESMNLVTANTATSTLVGSILRFTDSTTLGNTLRGIEIQTNRGTNTQGENTAIAGFGRTFGVRGTTEGDAGGVFEPAGVFAETRGTTQSNALRAFSSTITTSDLVSLFHSSSTFTGTGLLINLGNAGGSFSATSSRFVDFQNAGVSKFYVSAHGTTTIGDGTTNNMASLHIGFGGLCVDNDGTCTATTTGRISSVSTYTGNSDLAEMYFSSDALLPGEIVVSDGFISVSRARAGSEKRVLGVISTKPGVVMGADDSSLRAGQTAYPLALSGRVPVRLSTENGPIAVGDALTLSSLPGVAMKATGNDEIVGYALESFDGSRAYTEGYINQFGDDLVPPITTPTSVNDDSRIADGCTFGAGDESGVSPSECDTEINMSPFAVAFRTAVVETEYERRMRELEVFRQKPAEVKRLDNRTVQVGQVIMFVERGFVQSDAATLVLDELTSTSSAIVLGAAADSDETLWSRLKTIAQNFVDGVLTIAGIKTDKVETKELCVDDVCVDSDALRRLIELESRLGDTTETPVVEPDTNNENEDTNDSSETVVPPVSVDDEVVDGEDSSLNSSEESLLVEEAETMSDETEISDVPTDSVSVDSITNSPEESATINNSTTEMSEPTL